MDRLGFFLALVSCIAVVFAQDVTSRLCKDVTRQTCNGFQQCCSRQCDGPHQTMCIESRGRILEASCQCEGSGSGGFPGSGGPSTDHSSTCRSDAGSCRSFKDCCFKRCSRPTRMTCSSVGARITGAECICPAGSAGGMGTSTGGSHGSGVRSGADSPPVCDGKNHTDTCTRNFHNCNSFRKCCANHCDECIRETTCQETLGKLTNTLCKCVWDGRYLP